MPLSLLTIIKEKLHEERQRAGYRNAAAIRVEVKEIQGHTSQGQEETHGRDKR